VQRYRSPVNAGVARLIASAGVGLCGLRPGDVAGRVGCQSRGIAAVGIGYKPNRQRSSADIIALVHQSTSLHAVNSQAPLFHADGAVWQPVRVIAWGEVRLLNSDIGGLW